MTAEPAPRRIVFDDLEIGEISMELEYEPPQEVLRWGLNVFGDRVAMVTSLQVNSMVLLDMISKMDRRVKVITVDTGRLPEETLQFLDTVRDRYSEMDWNVLFPDSDEVEAMVKRNGINMFYDSVPNRFVCCHIRKVRPLTRALEDLDGWFTGLRRSEWASRAAIDKVELDHDHGGLVKINALADWTEEEVWDYIEEHDVPYHPLFDEGYKSIGCDPCTRPVEEDEPKRAGRWWWEEDAPKECGMNCPIETGNFEKEAEQILQKAHDEQ